MAWAILILAGVFEVIWAYSMKMSEGFTHLTPSIITVVFMILSVVLLSISMKTFTPWYCLYGLDRHWCNWIILVGIFFLHEPIGAMRMIAAVLIVSGLVLMKISFHPKRIKYVAVL